MTHTPGPWVSDAKGVFQEDGGGPICWVGDDYPRGDNHPTENMRLIAAAPELLAACERFVSLAKNWGSGSVLTKVPAYEDAVAAIKKATNG